MDYRDNEDNAEEKPSEGIEPGPHIAWKNLPGREAGELPDTLGAALYGFGLGKALLYQHPVHTGFPEGSLADRLVSRDVSALSPVLSSAWFRQESQIPADLENAMAPDDEEPKAVGSEMAVRSFPLPGRFLERMSHLLQARLPRVNVHLGFGTDRFLRRQRADAATIGNNVYVRTDRYDPESPAGLGLLGHELTHVAQQQTEYHQFPEYPVGLRQAEHRALLVERVVRERLETLRQYDSTSDGSVELPSDRGYEEPAVSPGSQPLMLAEESRDLGGGGEVVSASGTLSERDLRRIKDEVYNDLMTRIRQDSERGA